MITKYFRFNMLDDNEDTHWGYATGNGEYSSKNVSLDKIPYDEATGIIRSWLKNCGAITNTLEIDNAVARAFSKGSTSAVFRYDNGKKYRMTIETADNPITEWEDFERLDENIIKESKAKSNDDSINNLISKIEVYKDIVSNSWIPMPWEVTYSKVPEGLKLTIDTDEWFDKENPLGRLIDFILDIYNSDYDSSVRELTGIDIYSDVEFLGGEKSGYATYLIKSSKLDEATVAQAKRFASRKHGERGQVRKATGAPYIVHPEGVAKIVKDFGGDDEQIQAAWLHDTMEDTGTWEEDLREKFGDRVADLVSELTNDDFAIRSIGKEDYMSNKLVSLSDDALLIKLSDFLYNIKDYCPMKTLERMKKNLEALNFSGRKLDDKCDRLLIDCLKAIDEEM